MIGAFCGGGGGCQKVGNRLLLRTTHIDSGIIMLR